MTNSDSMLMGRRKADQRESSQKINPEASLGLDNSGVKQIGVLLLMLSGLIIGWFFLWWRSPSAVTEVKKEAVSLSSAPRAFEADRSPAAVSQRVSEGSPTGASVRNPQTTVKLPVLMYHYVRTVTDPRDRLGYNLSVTPQDFERQMRYLAEHGFTTVTPDDLTAAFLGRRTLPEKSLLLTFDDGYADFYEQAFPIFKKYNLKATLFVVTSFVGDAGHRYVTWEQIREMDRSGLVTIASHTLTHADVTKSKKASVEIAESKKILEDFVGHPVTVFAYPYGASNNAAAVLVQRAGYTLAFTTQGGTTLSYQKRLTLPRVRISGGLSLAAYRAKVEAARQKTAR